MKKFKVMVFLDEVQCKDDDEETIKEAVKDALEEAIEMDDSGDKELDFSAEESLDEEDF